MEVTSDGQSWSCGCWDRLCNKCQESYVKNGRNDFDTEEHYRAKLDKAEKEWSELVQKHIDRNAKNLHKIVDLVNALQRVVEYSNDPQVVRLAKIALSRSEQDKDYGIIN